MNSQSSFSKVPELQKALSIDLSFKYLRKSISHSNSQAILAICFESHIPMLTSQNIDEKK